MIVTNGWHSCRMSLDKNSKTPLDLAFDNKHTIILDYEKKYSVTLFADEHKHHLKKETISTVNN